MRHIEPNSDPWFALIEELMLTFEPGKLIPHEWLRKKFHLKELTFEEYGSPQELIEAYRIQQLDYMSLIDTLLWQLLEGWKVCLKNVYGEDYTIVAPDEQVRYGYDKFIKTVKASIKKSDMIINNVRPVSAAQQALDNDTKARYSMIKQMLLGMK